MLRLLSLFLALISLLPTICAGKETPKIAVWDLTSGDVKAAYAQDLTLILVSEISKLGGYEVYSQENIRTLAGWTEERIKLGCSSTQCLTALGQMDIAKLVSGRVGKIGNRYSISLSLFDTQNAKAEKAVSEFSRSEDDLIDSMQIAVRKLFGMEVAASKPEEKAPEKPTAGVISGKSAKSLEGNWQEKAKAGDSDVNLTAEGDSITIVYVKPSPKMNSYGYLPGYLRFRGTYSGLTLQGVVIYRDNDPRWVRCRGNEWDFPATGSVSSDGNTITLHMSYTDIHWNDCSIKDRGVSDIIFQRIPR